MKKYLAVLIIPALFLIAPVTHAQVADDGIATSTASGGGGQFLPGRNPYLQWLTPSVTPAPVQLTRVQILEQLIQDYEQLLAMIPTT